MSDGLDEDADPARAATEISSDRLRRQACMARQLSALVFIGSAPNEWSAIRKLFQLAGDAVRRVHPGLCPALLLKYRHLSE
jgi:hypothetical protein